MCIGETEGAELSTGVYLRTAWDPLEQSYRDREPSGMGSWDRIQFLPEEHTLHAHR